MANTDRVCTEDYQGRYVNHWAFGPWPSMSYRQWHFQRLRDFLNDRESPPDLSDLSNQLYDTRANAARIVQFSFASKLVPVLDPTRPIYDSHVARFYFLTPPTAGTLAQRVDT